MQIELDIFSGRPNPRWSLTEAQAAEFLARLRALPSTQRSGPVAGDLGYRGFIVRPNGDIVDGYDEVRLYHGFVITRRRDRVETSSDPKLELERWLLDSARGYVPEDVLGYIRNEIGR